MEKRGNFIAVRGGKREKGGKQRDYWEGGKEEREKRMCVVIFSFFRLFRFFFSI